MAQEVLSNAALNRALLARQHLLVRAKTSVPREVEHLIGLQAQEPKDPYPALWSRVAGFKPETLVRLLEQRSVVRMTLMRGTIHLVTVRDAYALRPRMQPVLERLLRWPRTFLSGIDVDEVAAAGRKILAKEPLTYAELGQRLHRIWPEGDPRALARVVQVRVPLPQVPPRGVWGKTGAARHVPLETWTKRDLTEGIDLSALVRRYLAAWGPASVQDMQRWCGLTKLQAVFAPMEYTLDRFTSPRGRALYDLPKAPRPAADTPTPPRFLPVFDNVTLGLDDRSRIIDPRIRLPVAPANSFVRFVLLGGVLGATWNVTEAKGTATMVVRPFVKVDASERAELREEGSRLLDALYGSCAERRVRFRQPGAG